MESEDKSMDTVKAAVRADGDKHFIVIEDKDEIVIPLSEDKPNDVKSAFNKLIVRIKKGLFQISLGTVGEDLFSQVAKEYIAQLNKEITAVHGEMEEHGLLEQ